MRFSFLSLCAFTDMTLPEPSYIELDRIFIEFELSYLALHFSQFDKLFHGSSLSELIPTMSMPEVLFEWFITGDVMLTFFL
jgi:hypothetical protein